jgi:hypothetical protein
MKKFFLLLLISLPIFMFASPMQSDKNPGIEAIKSALGAGDVDALARYFGESVEISILDSENIYPKAKATDTIRAFFNQNKPKGFAQMHAGKSKENADEYCIGKLSTGGTTYRVYLYLKMGGSQPQIQEIRFDKE